MKDEDRSIVDRPSFEDFQWWACRILLSLCCVFSTAFSWTNMSGTYIGKGPNLAVMVQIVETTGHNITGSL